MFNRTSSNDLARRLSLLLYDYHSIYESDPTILRNYISPFEMWRFMVNGNDQHRGYLDYENREPGYLVGMMNALQIVFRTNKLLSSDFILLLHETALAGVDKTNYDPALKYGVSSVIGQFRECEIGFYGLMNHTTTFDGLLEFKSNSHVDLSLGYNFTFLDKDIFDSTYVRLTDPALTAMREYLNYLDKPDSDEKDATVLHLLSFMSSKNMEALFYVLQGNINHALLGMAAIDSKTKLVEEIQRLLVANTNNKLLEYVYECVEERPDKIVMESNQVADAQSKLTSVLKTLTENYLRQVEQTGSPLETLRVIVTYIRECEQLHPFSDGNCRVFCMLLLNFLLMQNSFPPVILDDPNKFDMHSIEELMLEVIKGIDKTFALAIGRSINRINTTDYTNTLPVSDAAYFDDIVVIEIEGRGKNRSSYQP